MEAREKRRPPREKYTGTTEPRSRSAVIYMDRSDAAAAAAAAGKDRERERERDGEKLHEGMRRDKYR